MKVAVVIPCYNVESHIERCLESVFNQNGVELDVVCVNDGSTDSTNEKLNELQKRFVFRSVDTANQGACKARNIGLSVSTGEYVQFLDADDLLDSNKIESQLEQGYAENADVVIGAYTNHYSSGLVEQKELAQNNWEALIRTMMGTTSSNLWKRGTLEALGGWDEDLESSQDYELLFRFLKSDKQVCYDLVSRTSILKRDVGSISQSHKLENWKRYINLRERIRDFLRLRPDSDLELAIVDQYLFMAVRVIAQYDMALALGEHERLIPNGFRPKASKAISQRYLALYRIFGFAKTERLIKVFKPELYDIE